MVYKAISKINKMCGRVRNSKKAIKGITII